MKCEECKKETQVSKLFKWKDTLKHICQDCYKPKYYDVPTVRTSKDLTQIDYEKPLSAS